MIEFHKPSILPISLKHHGVNGSGDPLFRVVWSPTRFYMVGGSHTDYDGDPSPDRVVEAREKDPNVLRREVGYRLLPLYPGPGRWILELWKSAVAFTGCTPDQYEIQYRDPVTLLLTLGPYPSQGEYCQCQSRLWLDSMGPGIGEVDRTIYLIKSGWGYSYREHLSANKEFLEKQERDKFCQFKDIYQDARPAWKGRVTNRTPGRKSQNDIKITRSAEDLGLNRKRGLIAGNPHTPVRQQVSR